MTYKAANDLLELLNLFIEDKMLFLGKTTEETFTLIQTFNASSTDINLSDTQPMLMDIEESYCQQIFFGNRTPLIINDTQNHPVTCNLPLTSVLNVRSYLGVPIFYQNGEMFGTLCAVDSKMSNFTEKDIEVFERFSKLFSYVIELEKRVNIDSLTKLYNRSYLFDNFDYMAEKGTFMLLDLDGFKQVNDRYGHDVGDEVLIEVGKRIEKTIKEYHLPIRLGGDEFVIVFPYLLDNHKVDHLAQTLLASLSDWKEFDYYIDITASIGISKFPQDGNELQQIIKHADQAMYEAKQKGKNTYLYFKDV